MNNAIKIAQEKAKIFYPKIKCSNPNADYSDDVFFQRGGRNEKIYLSSKMDQFKVTIPL